MVAKAPLTLGRLLPRAETFYRRFRTELDIGIYLWFGSSQLQQKSVIRFPLTLKLINYHYHTFQEHLKKRIPYCEYNKSSPLNIHALKKLKKKRRAVSKQGKFFFKYSSHKCKSSLKFHLLYMTCMLYIFRSKFDADCRHGM
jgi:hypothetical protein